MHQAQLHVLNRSIQIQRGEDARVATTSRINSLSLLLSNTESLKENPTSGGGGSSAVSLEVLGLVWDHSQTV